MTRKFKLMRTATLLFSLLFFTVITMAQSRWSMGVDAQIGFTGINEYDTQDFDNNTGTTFYNIEETSLQTAAGGGLWVQYQLTRGAGLRMGLGYLNGGNKDRRLAYTEVSITSQQTLINDEIYHFRTHQLQVPLELVLEPGTAEVRMFFSVGAQLNNSWRGVIYQENDYGDRNYGLTLWNDENSSLENDQLMLIQPVASVGLRLNDQMVIRLRHAWAKPVELNWYQNYDHYDFSDSTQGVLICGVGSYYQTTTSHQRMTSLQFSYRVF